jgi:hypothetical protein
MGDMGAKGSLIGPGVPPCTASLVICVLCFTMSSVSVGESEKENQGNSSHPEGMLKWIHSVEHTSLFYNRLSV